MICLKVKCPFLEAVVTNFHLTKPTCEGTVNPKVKLGIKKTSSSTTEEVLWLDMDSIFGPDCYLAKVEWSKGGDALIVQVLDRRQKKLALVMFDAITGARTNLHLEEAIDDKSWVNLHDSFRLLDYIPGENFRFLWASEGDGYRHLFVRETNLSDSSSKSEFDSQELYRVTGPGEFIVDDVIDVDMEKKFVYYMGTAPGNWLGKQLFRASLESSGEDPECLTPRNGMHACNVDTKAGMFVDSVSTVDQPTTVSLYSLDDGTGEALLDMYDAGAEDTRVGNLNLRPPTFHTFPSTDKAVTLQSAVYLPDETIYGQGPYPLVVATYGGPHVQYVCDTWGMMTADLRSQYLCENVSQIPFTNPIFVSLLPNLSPHFMIYCSTQILGICSDQGRQSWLKSAWSYV